ncbi:hypothetical protein B0H13DRAFT_2439230 [Mycena leptocephala]|nr:hypothetical protein B0H13DRAFT_2439230 [Mycena leptocephala]
MLPGLEADRARVADLEAQISHLERSLFALQEEKILAQERLDSYKYPVLTLPNEIVSEIFIHFLPTYPLFPPLTGLLSPTLLTRICRRWREIALGTPALWCAISTSCRDGIPSKQKAHIFDLWLNRSRCCPLSLQLGGGNPRLDITQVLKTVIPRRARWEHLDLYLPPSHLHIFDSPMPLLRHLDLELSDYLATDSDVLATFCDVPLLHSVILDASAVRLMLPWAQLTSLTLLRVYPRQCVPILQKTTNLVHCKLEVSFDSDTDQPGPDITLLYLESLSIDQCSATPVTDFLETFIVPALHRLKIPEAFIGPNAIDSLTGFISKSGCKLEEVYISSDQRLLRQDSYCQAFPSIRKFSFDGEDDPSDSDFSDLEDNSDSE